MIILPSSISFHSFVAVYCQIYNIWLSLSLCSILIHAFILISLLSLGWMKFIFWNIPWEWLMGEQFPENLYMSPFYASLLEKKNWLFIKFLVHNSISWGFFFFFNVNPFLKHLWLSTNTCARAWPVAWWNMLFIFPPKGKLNWGYPKSPMYANNTYF